MKSHGVLRYSPKLNNASSKWWVVLDCDSELGRYQRHLYFVAHYSKLDRPAWSDHITVVRDEEPDDRFKSLWGKYDSELVEFEYLGWGTDTIYFWLNVTCPKLLDVRTELGLDREPEFPLHLTFGNVK